MLVKLTPARKAAKNGSNCSKEKQSKKVFKINEEKGFITPITAPY
jgi:hypothetical protein